MVAPDPPLPRPDPLAPLQEALAGAGDGTLGRVVGLLDSLEARGAADGLLTPLRPRLGALRPPRPLRFTRLLCLPLEPVLVDAADWRDCPAVIPRSALTPLAGAVRAALGPLAEEIEMAGLGHTMAETALVARLGARLWPLAAEAPLPALPPGWAEAGLVEDAAPRLLALARGLWRAAPR